ncbi:Epsin-2 protein [Spatholobus suberectus]|nr:Epsin-2 protein [Spatholobus suberectus]
MGSLFLEQIKKQTTSFLQEKYKSARMTFTDVTEAELLAEEATNKDDCSPDAKTMTRIAEASFDIDEYWRIVDVLHKRLYNVDWEEWRQSYKALVLLEFLLTHGPQEFAQEFQCDAEIIEELGSFTHIDERGFNWGSRMQKLSDQIVKLLQDGEALREARLKALKITNEIHGFGSSLNSPSSSSSSPCSLSSEASAGSSSFYSFSATSTPAYIIDSNDQQNKHQSPSIGNDGNIVLPLPPKNAKRVATNHLWKRPAGEEKNVLIDSDEDEDVEKPKGFVSEFCSKIIGSSPIRGENNREKIEFRCLSDVGSKVPQKKFDRQYSLWF